MVKLTSELSPEEMDKLLNETFSDITKGESDVALTEMLSKSSPDIIKALPNKENPGPSKEFDRLITEYVKENKEESHQAVALSYFYLSDDAKNNIFGKYEHFEQSFVVNNSGVILDIAEDSIKKDMPNLAGVLISHVYYKCGGCRGSDDQEKETIKKNANRCLDGLAQIIKANRGREDRIDQAHRAIIGSCDNPVAWHVSGENLYQFNKTVLETVKMWQDKYPEECLYALEITNSHGQMDNDTMRENLYQHDSGKWREIVSGIINAATSLEKLYKDDQKLSSRAEKVKEAYKKFSSPETHVGDFFRSASMEPVGKFFDKVWQGINRF